MMTAPSTSDNFPRGKMFYQDYSKLYTAIVLNTLSWEALRHPPYSPKVAP